jgi:hypothetical protein
LNTVAPLLVAASAAIILMLGIIHLLYTFYGPKLLPRDPELQTRMSDVSPRITHETTMWKCWIGFNASHSLGVLLFGAVYGYLALWHGALLFNSPFLQWLGLLTLGGYILLGKCYWFSVPFRAIVLATILYVLAIVANWI